MKLTFFILLILTSSCSHKSVEPEVPIITRKDATIYIPSLLSDSCKSYISFYERMGVVPSYYVPSEKTRGELYEFILEEFNNITTEANVNRISVTIKFKKTGKASLNICGSGKKSDFNSIDILSILRN